MKLKRVIRRLIPKKKAENKKYLRRYYKYSFYRTKCSSYEQYEAVITRLYHTIEKGLSYINYREGFGRDNIDTLIEVLEAYINNGFSHEAFFYKTALSTLKAYVDKNEEYGLIDNQLKNTISKLAGTSNTSGGVLEVIPLSKNEVQKIGFEELIKNRHSIRHFSKVPVDICEIKKAVEIAQYTPSACNRQGWKVKLIKDKDIMHNILENQNGNRGFGQEIDKLLIVLADLRYFNRDRETYQAFIDGGMYAENLLNSLHYMHIASVPLSASLTEKQENNIRNFAKIDDAEVIIMFIGIGNYPEKCITTKSERHEARIEML